MMKAIAAAVVVFLSAGPVTAGQNSSPQDPAATSSAPTSAPASGSDRAVDPSQPDFTLVALPTTLRMPRFGGSFRVTHRFTRPIDQGNFGDFVDDFFGFDSAAQVGLEFRFGLFSGTQFGFYRTNDRIIQLSLQHQVIRQRGRSPVGIDAIGVVEGGNNLRDDQTPAIGAIISRSLNHHGALYLQPIWVNNTNSLPAELVDNNNTFMLGVGGRIRIRPNVYIVAEAAPRFGYKAGGTHASVAIERRAGGHSFQLNFSNGLGSTLGQIAGGGFTNDSWIIGFNISRKFF